MADAAAAAQVASAPRGPSKEAELPSVLAGADPWAIDLLLSALTAAATSYRRATCTTPFPAALFEAAGAARDFAALAANLQSLPPADQLTAGADAGRLSSQQAALLLWALTRPRRPVGGVRRCTLRQVQEQLASLTGWVADIGHNPSLRPQHVLQLSAVPAELAAGDSRTRVLAFHGTSMENVWSILINGLLNASGTRLERTGAAFGKGIYFSTELPVAFSFCQPANSWARSALGSRLRCLLVCSIDREHAQGAHNSSEVPERYIVVERMDAVQMHFVFVYRDDAAPSSPAAAAAAAAAAAPAAAAAAAAGAHGVPRHGTGAHLHSGAAAAAAPQRRSPLVYVLVAYVMWMLWLAIKDNLPFLRRLLRRRLGIRL